MAIRVHLHGGQIKATTKEHDDNERVNGRRNRMTYNLEREQARPVFYVINCPMHWRKKTEKWNVSTKIWAKCEHKQRHTPGVTVNSNYYYKLKRIRPFETIATQYLINSIIGPALLMITIFSARSEIQTRI